MDGLPIRKWLRPLLANREAKRSSPRSGRGGNLRRQTDALGEDGELTNRRCSLMVYKCSDVSALRRADLILRQSAT